MVTLALPCTSQPAAAHPSIERWNYEGTVYRLDERNGNLLDVRLGDPVRGTISFDRTTPGLEFSSSEIFYEHAAEFVFVTLILENPRTGNEHVYGRDYSIGVTVADEENWRSSGTIVDDIYIWQLLRPPPEITGLRVFADVIFLATEAIDNAQFPAELNLDDWDSVTLDIDHSWDDFRYFAEIYSLTPVDVPFIPGDFNGDGSVDGWDLEVWKYAYGYTDYYLAADANGDRHIDGRDFLAWQRQFGSTTAPTTIAVPEPGTTVFVACGLIAFAALRRGKDNNG